ncbi:AfsR/SARP family transcriptional regulator [Nocardiopsis sp. CNT-189]|uniref:AfsR/SARP family transcriptional regulator n=1 Tax=Nocardiopsis oceanisediminis TaxID=2816862 RepID=UPI003B29E391
MCNGITYSVLGPLTLRQDGNDVPLPTRRSRITLSHLLADLGRYTHKDALLESLDTGRENRSGHSQLHKALSELRKTAVPVERHGEAYRLIADRTDVDCHVFDDLRRQGEKHASDERLDEAADCLSRSLSLWKGKPFSELDSPHLAANSDFWCELHVSTLETFMDVQLRRGRHREVIADLRKLTRQYELREAFFAQLMIALYHSFRMSEALMVFDDLRSRLLETLGTDPSPDLQLLRLRILRQEPDLPASRVTCTS